MTRSSLALQRGTDRFARSSRFSDRHVQILLGARIGAAGLLLVLAEKATTGKPFAWDRSLFAQLYTGESPWSGSRTSGQQNEHLNAMLPFLQTFADARALLLLMGAAFALLVLFRLKRAAALFVAAVAVTAFAPLLKEVFDRPSPFPLPNDPSFPSGHAIASMALVAGIVAIVPPGRWRLLVILVGGMFVVAVGLAVITDGGHWPSDVIAGWCISVLWIAGLRLISGHSLTRSDRDRPISSIRGVEARSASAPSTKGV